MFKKQKEHLEKRVNFSIKNGENLEKRR